MVGLSTLVILGGHPKIWMLYTIHKYVFLAFLDKPAIVLPPTITLISQSGALGLSSTPLFRFGVPLQVLSAPNELL